MVRRLSMTIVIGGLAILNVLTLVHDGVERAAYRLLKAIPWHMVSRSASETVASRAVRSDEARQLRIENKGLKTRTATLEADAESMKKAAETRKAAVRRMKTGVVRRTTLGAMRGVATVVPKAIPIVGVPTIVAVTTLDIKDACDTLRDIDEMETAFDGPSQSESRKVCGIRIPTVDEVRDRARTFGSNVGQRGASPQ
jgi:hypothetical protein